MPIIFDVLPISLSQSRLFYRKADCFCVESDYFKVGQSFASPKLVVL
jgi:cytochrome c oxidase assembly protein Cox11